MGYLRAAVIAVSVYVVVGATVYAEERDPAVSRVPGDQVAAAKAMKNPIAMTPESIAKGRAIFEGQGTCLNCHGTSGKGDGPVGSLLNPTPRNFTNPKFHKNRTDGEMFWVIKNGSPGTGMVPLIGTAITEEEAWYVINYERSFNPEK